MKQTTSGGLLPLLKKHYLLIGGALFFVIGTVIRFLLRDLPSGDSTLFLVPWYHEIQDGGGLQYLGHQVGDYNILYQTLIALFTYLPLQPLHAYKLFSCCFDVLLALLTAWIVYRVSEQRPELCALAAFTMIYLSPIVCINSAWWAQCDAIYTFFGLAALYLLSKKQDLTAFLLYGVSMTFKLQAIFLMPVMLFVVFCRKKRHLFYVLLIPAVMVILSSAGLAAGRRITDVFSIYLNQTSSYHAVALNYPSVWGLLSDTGHLINYFSGHEAVSAEQLYDFIKYPAILITGAALAVLMLLWLKKKAVIDLKSILMMAFLLCYTCVIFLPSMHERYGYVYEILALIIAFFNRRTIPLVIIMYCVTLITYIHFLSDNYFVPISILSVINIVIYILYIRWIHQALFPKNNDSQPPEMSRFQLHEHLTAV